MTKPKPTSVPKTPALVRKGAAALAVGFGLSGAACGGIESTKGGNPPLPDGSDDGSIPSDAEADAMGPLPPPTPILIPAPPIPDGGFDSEVDDVLFLPPVPPTPTPHP